MALHDPNFPDMYQWMTSSANEPPKTLTADAANAIPIMSEAEGNHDTPATETLSSKICPDPEPPQHLEERMHGIEPTAIHTVINTPKRSRSNSIQPSPPPSPKRTKLTNETHFKKTKNPKAPTLSTSSAQETSSGPVGISQSAMASRKLKAEMKAGTFVANEAKKSNFEALCLAIDLGATFRYGESWKVFHSDCGNWYTMSEAYNTTKFRQHIETCKKTKTSSNSAKPMKFLTINKFFAPVEATQTSMKTKSKPQGDVKVTKHPCSGITALHDPRSPTFIRRTGADGGGARSVTDIAKELYQKGYSELSERKKTRVDITQMQEWSFCFDRQQETIYLTNCEKFVKVANDSDGPHTCPMCLHMLRSDSRLKSGLRVKTPETKNYKFLNEKYQGKSIAEIYAKTQGLQELIEDKASIPL
jgi:hypothetical protein